jgi:hypothetical protein
VAVGDGVDKGIQLACNRDVPFGPNMSQLERLDLDVRDHDTGVGSHRIEKFPYLERLQAWPCRE